MFHFDLIFLPCKHPDKALLSFSLRHIQKSVGAVPVARPTLQGVSHCPLSQERATQKPTPNMHVPKIYLQRYRYDMGYTNTYSQWTSTVALLLRLSSSLRDFEESKNKASSKRLFNNMYSHASPVQGFCIRTVQR